MKRHYYRGLSWSRRGDHRAAIHTPEGNVIKEMALSGHNPEQQLRDEIDWLLAPEPVRDPRGVSQFKACYPAYQAMRGR